MTADYIIIYATEGRLIEEQIENFSGIGSLGEPVTKTNRHSLLGDMYVQDYSA